MAKNKNNIDKAISYGTIKDPTFAVYRKGGPVQLELPLEDPNNNVLPWSLSLKILFRKTIKKYGRENY